MKLNWLRWHHSLLSGAPYRPHPDMHLPALLLGWCLETNHYWLDNSYIAPPPQHTYTHTHNLYDVCMFFACFCTLSWKGTQTQLSVVVPCILYLFLLLLAVKIITELIHGVAVMWDVWCNMVSLEECSLWKCESSWIANRMTLPKVEVKVTRQTLWKNNKQLGNQIFTKSNITCVCEYHILIWMY